MIRGSSIKSIFESRCQPGGGGPSRFVRESLHALGLRDGKGGGHGRPYTDHTGKHLLKDPPGASGNPRERMRPEEYSLRELSEGILGPSWQELLRPDLVMQATLMESAQHLLEAGTGATGPSAFANINAWTAVVAGLLEIKVMEGWENPEFIADELMPAEPTKMFDGRKVNGTTRIGDRAEERLPGMPTARVQIGERWIVQPRTVENALSAEVLQEAVFLDLTGEVLQQAEDVGTWAAYRKELRCIDAFIGATNTYNYKGTTYNTYIPAGYYDNSFSNELLHESDVEEALIKFRDMVDPETGTRVLISPNAVLVQREKLRTAEAIFGANAQGVEYRANDTAGTPMMIRTSQPAYKGKFTIIESPLVYERLVASAASGGLALSAANAARYWWMFEKGKAMKYAQNWPLRIQKAAPNQLDMIDRGVVLFVKADERGIPMVYEPRRVVRCTN